MSFTIITGKESASPKRSLFLVSITSPDGDASYFTTAAYYGAPNIVYGATTFQARILGNDIEKLVSMGPLGYDTATGLTLTLADADKSIWRNHCVAHGWRGSTIVVTQVLWDAPTNTYSTDAMQWVFIGGNPGYKTKNGIITVDATSYCNFARVRVPSVPIGFRCPWIFPPDTASQTAALNDPTSPFFQCGYSAQVGGVGNGAFTSCTRVRSACMARLGNSATTSVAPDGDITHDVAGHPTGRFGGHTWIAPASYRGNSYTGNGKVYGFNQPNQAIIGSYINQVYGTQWVTCSVLAPASDPNSTRAECVVCFAPFGQATVLKVIVSGVEVPHSNSDQLFTWRYVNQGGRNGAVEGDAIFDSHGDPHGSQCVIEFVVPIQLVSGGSVPTVLALVTGPPILSINSGLSFVYNAPDLGDTDGISGPAANPVFAYLDLMVWGGVATSRINPASWYAASQKMAHSVSYVAADGTTQSHAAFKCSFALLGTNLQVLGTVLAGIRNSSNLIVVENGITGLIECGVKGTLADQQSAPVAGSNDTTARTSVTTDGTTANGYYAYLFDESNIEPGTFNITSPRINAIPNVVAFGFQDERNGYQQDSITEIDPVSLKYSGNQQIQTPIQFIGIPNFDQATRQANCNLGQVLFGNARDDQGGTEFFEFTCNQRVSHMASMPGAICGLQWEELAIGVSAPQAIRILSLQPDIDGNKWKVTAAWHRDEWYEVAYGQNPTPFQFNPLLGAPDRPPYPWHPQVFSWDTQQAINPGHGSFNLKLDVSSFPSSVSVSGVPPCNQQALYRPPIVPYQMSTANTGGHLVPGQYYVAVSVEDAVGPLSEWSVVQVPAGTSTNTIRLDNIQWNSGPSALWNVAVGNSPMNAQLFIATTTVNSTDSNGNPTSITISDITGGSGLSLHSAGFSLPDVAAYGFKVFQTAVRQGGVWGDTISSVTGGNVLNMATGGHTVNQWVGYILSLIYRPGTANQKTVDLVITSNTSSTITVTASGLGAGFLAADVVVCRFKTDTHTATTIGDSTNSINALAPAGLGDFSGCMLWIISGTGSGYTPKSVVSNTAGGVFTVATAFDVTPDATSVFILINPTPTDVQSTPAFANLNNQLEVQVGTVKVVDTAESYLLLQVAVVDQQGRYSPLAYQPYRELYIPPQDVGNSTPVTVTVTTTATIAAGTDIVLVDATAGAFTLTLPAPVDLVRPMSLVRLDATANAVTVQHSSGTVQGGATIALDNSALKSMTLAQVTSTASKVQSFYGTTGSTGTLSIYNPQYYGGDPTGAANSDAAISSAITAGGLEVPYGSTFLFTWAGISTAFAAISGRFRIYGGGTLKLASGSTSALTFAGSAIIRVVDITVDGNGMTGTSALIQLNAATNVYLTNVTAMGAGSNPNFATSGTCTYEISGCHGITTQTGLI